MGHLTFPCNPELPAKPGSPDLPPPHTPHPGASLSCFKNPHFPTGRYSQCFQFFGTKISPTVPSNSVDTTQLVQMSPLPFLGGFLHITDGQLWRVFLVVLVGVVEGWGWRGEAELENSAHLLTAQQMLLWSPKF